MLALTACAPQAPTPSKPESKPAESAAKPTAAPAMATAAPAKAPAAAPAAPAAKAEAKAEPAKPAGPSRVTFGITTVLEGWSPYTQTGAQGYSMWQNVMEALVLKDLRGPTPVFRPGLAESWDAPKGDVWTFHLRKGVKFTDGGEFTSADVLHSYNRILNDDDSKQGGQLSYIESMETPDPYTFVAKLKQPNVVFLDEVRNRVITSKAHFEKLGKEQADKNPIGTGPYLFKEWIDGQRFVVTRNPNYYGTKPAVDEVIYRTLLEDEVRLTALLNGEIDIAQRISPENVNRIGGRAHAEMVDGQRVIFLVMRPDMPPTDNKLVRQAIYHAINREIIVKNVQDGYATELKGPLPALAFGYEPNLPTYEFNPDKAKELLAQAGQASGLSIDLYLSPTTYVKAKEVGQVVVDMLKNVGITCNLHTPESATFSNGFNAGQYGFYLTGRGNTEDPSAYLNQYYRTDASKRTGYSNPEYDKLIDSQQGVTDTTERARQISEAQRILMEDVPSVWLYTYKDIWGVANHVDWTPLSSEYIWAYEVKLKG
jgi:peptide/nickel transport system substrate-binding protein